MRPIAALFAVALVVTGVWYLRDATMSTHTVQDPESRLALVVEADTHGAEPGQSLREYTYAKILSCRTEVGRSDPVDALKSVGDTEGRFRIVLQPSLDDTNRTQFRGCLEDWNLDHVQIDVISMEHLPPPTTD